MPTHVIYIDDSGTKDYSDTGYATGPTRYFVFAGILTTLDVASQMAQRLKAGKMRLAGSPTIELKSNWLRMPHERARRYLTPFGMSDHDLDQLVDLAYDIILESDIKLIAAVVDKEHMQDSYGENAYYPPAVSYEGLAQRLQKELEGKGRCQVIIDDMTGKNPKGNEHKRNLQRHHATLRKNGSRLRGTTMSMDVLADLKFFSSANTELLQLADLVAYNVYRQFFDHGEDWESGSGTLPMYSQFNRIVGKFRSSESGRVQGYGIVKFPMLKRVLWTKTPRK